jgi:hypothetical protein
MRELYEHGDNASVAAHMGQAKVRIKSGLIPLRVSSSGKKNHMGAGQGLFDPAVSGLSADFSAASSQLMHWRQVRPEMVTTGTIRFTHFGQHVV